MRALFGGKPDSAHVVLWELADRSSSSFTDVKEAQAWANGRTNVYVHAGLTMRAFSGPERPSADQIDGLAGLWADIDIASPVHRKTGLAADELTARRIAASPGLAPSCIVASGHGLQCWWLLPEPWMFETPGERLQAATLVRAWDLSLRKRATKLGATLDAVGDLPRLMRLPDTVNHKPPAEPVDVKVLEINDRRYSVDDFEQRLIDGCWAEAERELAGRGRATRAADGDLVLNPGAEPPFEKLFILAENEPRVWQTWNRTRRDAKGWSASEYDLALARFAALAGWSRQEIANILIASRRKHGDDLKLRQDYYALTIDKALSDQAEREVIGEAVAIAEELRAHGPPEAPADQSAILQKVSAAIGVEITRMVRSASDPPVLRIETPVGDGTLGGIGVLISNHKFREKFGEITNLIPRRMKGEQWDPLAQALLSVAEVEELGVEATVRGQVETWLSLYLGERLPRKLDDLEARTRENLAHLLTPFIGEDGRARVFGSGFRRWLSEIQHERLTSTELGSMLRAMGCTPETRHFRLGGRRTSRALWVLPIRGEEGAA